MPPGALQGQRSAGPPKVVGEILKRGAGTGAPPPAVVEGTAAGPGRRRQQPSGAPAAAAMVLAKDMATGRGKSSGTAAAAGSHSPRAARPSAATSMRPKPVPPSVSRKTVAAVVGGSSRKPQPANKCRRPTSAERVKVYTSLYVQALTYIYGIYRVI